VSLERTSSEMKWRLARWQWKGFCDQGIHVGPCKNILNHDESRHHLHQKWHNNYGPTQIRIPAEIDPGKVFGESLRGKVLLHKPWPSLLVFRPSTGGDLAATPCNSV